MRVALLLSGNIRTFELCTESFDKLAAKFDDLDVFIFTSNIAFDLHPWIKQSHNFYDESILDIDAIKQKLSLAPILTSKIKKITILDKESEEEYIKTKYSHLCSHWEALGVEIFKQFAKFDRNINQLEEYAIQNDITYDYIIKTRFDLDIDVNSLPISLENNIIYSSSGVRGHSTSNPSPDWINDIIFTVNDINTFKIITTNVLNSFFENKCIENIHNVLNSIFTRHQLQNIPYISSELNRNFSLVVK